MSPRNVKLVFQREVRDQLRDRRTLFMIVVLPLLLYPSLGIGMLQMMTTFREQPRQVVVLGAENLPSAPPLLDDFGIREDWFHGGADDAARLRVTTDRPLPESDDETSKAARADDLELLVKAEELRQRVAATSEQQNDPREELAQAFRESGIDVLVVVPEAFGPGVALANEAIRNNTDVPEYPGPVIIRNTADEKSMVASQRVSDALENWEQALLSDRLAEAGLPPDIHEPAQIHSLDLARGEEIAATMWSKLFPALLIVMTVTGAFYPAIDLGAGEKERGTMETLLICPAYRSEIVLGKFLTVMLFSSGTAILNLASMGFTGQYMVSMVAPIGPAAAAGMTFPPVSAMFWLFVLMVPIAALFSALCLGLATFAKSSKEGQYYLTPLLMVTLGLTVFCLSPSVEITPLYSVLPVINVALLLKGLLLAPLSANSLYAYIVPVLVSSAGYSLLALWWAIELFGSESVLFRAAERVSPRLWLRQLIRDRKPLPTFSQAIFCFVAIMFLQFGAMRFMQSMLAAEDPATTMLRMLIVQQVGIIALPAVLMTLILTRSRRRTLKLQWPNLRSLAAAAALAIVLHPLSFELSASLSGWFFPELPSELQQAMGLLTSDDSNLWLLLGVFALAPAICEEIAFRGFILSGLGRSGRTGLAIIGSSLAFGIMHMIPQQVFNASLLGLVLGLIAVRSRSLLACIAFHLVYNSLGVLHGYFGQHVTTNGIYQYLFRHDGSVLRYQPLLLAMLAVIAYRLIRWVAADPETADAPQWLPTPDLANA